MKRSLSSSLLAIVVASLAFPGCSSPSEASSEELASELSTLDISNGGTYEITPGQHLVVKLRGLSQRPRGYSTEPLSWAVVEHGGMGMPEGGYYGYDRETEHMQVFSWNTSHLDLGMTFDVKLMQSVAEHHWVSEEERTFKFSLRVVGRRVGWNDPPQSSAPLQLAGSDKERVFALTQGRKVVLTLENAIERRYEVSSSPAGLASPEYETRSVMRTVTTGEGAYTRHVDVRKYVHTFTWNTDGVVGVFEPRVKQPGVNNLFNFTLDIRPRGQ